MTTQESSASASAEDVVEPAIDSRAPRLVVGPRPPRPELQFNMTVAVLATTAAVATYVAFLALRTLPQPPVASIMFAAAPLCGLLALPVFISRSRAENNVALTWFSAGLALATLSMILQFISIPTIVGGRGPFGTDDQSSAILYFFFHLALVVGVLAAARELPITGCRWFLGIGAVLALAVAANLVSSPELLGPDGSFTGVVVVLQWAFGIALALVLVLWLKYSGRISRPLYGWISLCLLLLVYESLLGALSSGRFDDSWWASLTLRMTAFMVLLAGSVLTILRQLRRLESYSEAELSKSDSQLESSLLVGQSLLDIANDLTGALVPQEVARRLASGLTDVLDMEQLVIFDRDPGAGRHRVLYRHGNDHDEWRLDLERWGDSLIVGEPIMATGHTVTSLLDERQGGLGSAARDAKCVVNLPLRAGGLSIGSVFAIDTRPVHLSPWIKELLAGLAAQTGPALSRARLYEREHATAVALQRALLPEELPRLGDVEVAARYEAGQDGVTVGGDWYDCISLDEGRVALVVGDVMGKGVQAASLMGRLRDATRVLVSVDPSPASVLSGLNDVLAEAETDRIVTAAYALLDPGVGEIRLAMAGHPLPIICHPSGQVDIVSADGLSPLLGVPVGARPEVVVPIAAGSSIVMYTDGLVETRQGLDPGMANLVEQVGSSCRTENSIDEVVDHLMRSRRTGGLDDIALIVARLRQT